VLLLDKSITSDPTNESKKVPQTAKKIDLTILLRPMKLSKWLARTQLVSILSSKF